MRSTTAHFFATVTAVATVGMAALGASPPLSAVPITRTVEARPTPPRSLTSIPRQCGGAGWGTAMCACDALRAESVVVNGQTFVCVHTWR